MNWQEAAGNIHLHLDLIAGLPYEGYADFANTFNETYEYCTDNGSDDKYGKYSS